MVLEYEDVQFFKAEVINEADNQFLKVSGLAFHSSLVVSDIKELPESDGVKVLIVTLSPTKKSMSGDFEYKVKIEPNLRTIKFGKEKYEIWSRQ